jgi:Bacterial protein of unknown function (DUF853)
LRSCFRFGALRLEALAKHRILSDRARSRRPAGSEDHRVIGVDGDWCRNRVPKVTHATAHPDVPVRLPLGVMNGHGLGVGATGSGRTKTLQAPGRAASGQGEPVFPGTVLGREVTPSIFGTARRRR